METGFYKEINRRLAKLNPEHLTFPDNRSLAFYIAIAAYHSKFATLSYIGIVYRSMGTTKKELNKYEPGKHILTKTFAATYSIRICL